MNPVVKSALQGAIPTLVLVGGTNLIVKKFRNSKPVLYWGSLAVATGVAVAVVQGRIPAPFMNAETFDAEYCDCGDNAWNPSCEMHPKCLWCENESVCYIDDCYACKDCAIAYVERQEPSWGAEEQLNTEKQ